MKPLKSVHAERGQALAEFAIVATVAVAVLACVFELRRPFNIAVMRSEQAWVDAQVPGAVNAQGAGISGFARRFLGQAAGGGAGGGNCFARWDGKNCGDMRPKHVIEVWDDVRVAALVRFFPLCAAEILEEVSAFPLVIGPIKTAQVAASFASNGKTPSPCSAVDGPLQMARQVLHASWQLKTVLDMPDRFSDLDVDDLEEALN